MDSPDSPMEKSITYSDEIELDANQNSFSLQVAALSYQAPEMNRLEYKLEGFNSEWYTVGRNSMINYSNLPYGSYTLRIKGSNSDGKWNEAQRVLKIRIRPPFTCLPGPMSFMYYWLYVLWLPLFSILGEGPNRSISRPWRSLSVRRRGNCTRLK